ncbi:MAG: glycoside hydrolase family 15 protein [Myxococcota bacterium]
MALRIEDYALIGDCESAALVGRNGSIDWLCWPRFDSSACFARLLGDVDNGHWQILPEGPVKKSRRRYRDGTLILESDYICDSGQVRVIDFMPPRDHHSDIVRLVIGVEGEVAMRSELRVRFDYGAVVPWVTRLEDGALRAVAGPDMVILRTTAQHQGVDHMTQSVFTVRKGEQIPFVLMYAPSHGAVPDPVDPVAQLADTEHFWREWSGRCLGTGPYIELIRRSLITLKALTYAPTGGIIAAPTTSLPEHIGGSRNWDYRYCWLRDAALTLEALLDAGYTAEAVSFRDWLMRAAANSPDHLQIMYGLAGERRLTELELPWLSGYADSKPVRTGNAAAEQFQLDVYGEIADAMAKTLAAGAPPDDNDYRLHQSIVRHLEGVWRHPDYGIWEVRGEPQHFTYSKVMVWVAFDRAIRAAEDKEDGDAPLSRWRAIRDAVHAEVCERAWNEGLGAFTQAYGSPLLDAAVLRMPHVGFLSATDPRMVSTIAAVEKRLSVDGFVRRYDTARVDDGLDQGEGVFLACSFWLVDNLIMQGRLDEADVMFAKLAALCNDVGLLAEEYDPRTGTQLGNFPQAFSHVALVATARRLQRAHERR